MAQNIGIDFSTNDIEVFVGNTAGSTDPSVNKLCYTGIMEGFIDCGETIEAQYIIFHIITYDTQFSLTELLAWDEPLIEIDIDSLEIENMSIDDTTSLLGSDDTKIDYSNFPVFTLDNSEDHGLLYFDLVSA